MSEKITAFENLADFFVGFWGLLNALPLAVVIAGFGIYIAYQQLRTNRDNLREKLFERRIRVYEEVRTVLGEVMRSGTGKPSEDGVPLDYKLGKAAMDAKFLFGFEVSEFIEEIRHKVIDMQMHESLMEARDQDREKHIEMKYEYFRWLIKQHDPLFEHVKKYLKFEK